MIRTALIACCLLTLPGLGDAQSFVFGVRGGMVMGLQQWNGFQRDPLFGYHADLFIESWDLENRFSIYGTAGYHIRGSVLRTRRWFDPETMLEFPGNRSRVEFGNAVLSFGAKQKFPFGLESRAYYAVAVRGEYTLLTDFDDYLEVYEEFNNDFLFGMSIGAGIEIPISRFVGGSLEISAHPDFTRQLNLPPQDTGFTDPVSGEPIIIPEQTITNVTFEITLGIRFLREVIYVE